MDLYNAFESRSSENYLIQGIESNGSPFSDSLEAMYTDGTQEYLVDQGLYYPAATNYGYYCTGYESQQGGWEEQHRLFGVDGVGAQYLGQGECFPYVYYTPCYGYGHSVYSPYSPSCGGVGMGAVDSSGPFVDHYYTAGGCENAVSVASSSSAAHQQLPWWNNVKDVPSSGASLASNHRPVPGPVVRVSEPPPPPKKKQPSRDAAQPAQRQAVAGGSSSRSDDRISVKAYTRKAGDRDSEGNIIIRKDEYNRGGFALGDYAHGRFFVIKSYSEDDVHKSIKYNVWSSTPNGNKKLNAAYEASKGCRVLLFFSVNASGQFCGAAEMTGPVDFYRDMDFWQQDKWSGSFPVRWHFIKDVPNTYFRHILLENNENKPVTNSRDTQEVKCLKGVEMLRIFNNYAVKTSLLDDFMFYEKRQEMMMMRSPDHDDEHQVSESPLVGAAAAEFSAISIQDDDKESLVCKAPRPSPAFLRVGTISLSLHDDDHPHMK